MNKFTNIQNRISANGTFGVRSIGRCIVNEETGDIPHKNEYNDYHLIVLAKGALILSNKNGMRYEMHEGDVAIIRPDVETVTLKRGVREDYWMNFYGVDEIMKQLNLDQSNEMIFHFKQSTISRLIGIFNELITEIQLQQFGYEIFSREKLLQLLLVISRSAHNDKMISGNNIDKIKPALIEMNNNYQKTKPVKYYADLCNMSQSSFMHTFSRLMKTTPIKFINSLKLANAKSLLLDSTLTISEIADMLGFSSPLYFSDLFFKEFHIRPTDYRKTNR